MPLPHSFKAAFSDELCKIAATPDVKASLASIPAIWEDIQKSRGARLGFALGLATGAAQSIQDEIKARAAEEGTGDPKDIGYKRDGRLKYRVLSPLLKGVEYGALGYGADKALHTYGSKALKATHDALVNTAQEASRGAAYRAVVPPAAWIEAVKGLLGMGKKKESSAYALPLAAGALATGLSLGKSSINEMTQTRNEHNQLKEVDPSQRPLVRHAMWSERKGRTGDALSKALKVGGGAAAVTAIAQSPRAQTFLRRFPRSLMPGSK